MTFWMYYLLMLTIFNKTVVGKLHLFLFYSAKSCRRVPASLKIEMAKPIVGAI